MLVSFNARPSVWTREHLTGLGSLGKSYVDLRYGHDGATLWAAVDDTLQSWRRANRTESSTWANTISAITIGHSSLTSLAVGPDSIMVGSRDGSVKIFGLDTGQPERVFHTDGPVYAIAVDSKYTHCASGMLDGTLQLNRLAEGELLSKTAAHRDRITAIGFHPHDESLLATASHDGDVTSGD